MTSKVPTMPPVKATRSPAPQAPPRRPMPPVCPKSPPRVGDTDIRLEQALKDIAELKLDLTALTQYVIALQNEITHGRRCV